MKQRKLIRQDVLLLILIFVSSMLVPKYAAAADNPSLSYPYGLNSLADDRSDAQQMLITEWEAWKNTFISKSGSKRVLGEDGVSTLSEGMGHGLLLSVYFNDQTLFDELFKYVKSCFNANGLMSWKTNNGQLINTNDSYSAADADQNIALALIFADKMWGSDGTVKYETEAEQMLSKIYQYEISDGQVKRSDGFTDPRNPSYLAPACYEIFSGFDQSHNWSSVRVNAYTLIKKAQNPTTGLVPEWCNLSGTGQKFGGSTSVIFGYESTDLILNMALAYSWYGHAEAKTICSKLTSFFGNIKAANIVDGYQLDGTPTGRNHSDCFVSSAAAGFMTGTDRQTAKSFYNECIATTSSTNIGSTLRLFTLMYMTGNYQNLYEGGTQIVGSADTGTEDVTVSEEQETDEPEQEPVQETDDFEQEPVIEETNMEITLRASGASGAVELDWNSIEGIPGYYIYKATKSGAQGNTPETDFWISGTTYKDTKVKPGTQYFYIVKPVMGDQSMGEASNEAAATPRGGTQGSQFNTEPGKPLGKSGTIELTIGNPLMKANGKTKAIDAGKRSSPIISAGRTFVPVNAIIGEMGGKVVWSSKGKKVTILVADSTIELWMGKATISVNGVKKAIDAVPYITKNGTQMLPLRYIMENLGCVLIWENKNAQMVTIEYDFN